MVANSDLGFYGSTALPAIKFSHRKGKKEKKKIKLQC